MVADMSVGVYGVTELRDELKRNNKLKEKNNEILQDLLKVKEIEVANKKPDIMFLFELLDFLKSIPQWIPNYDELTYDQAFNRPKACFVGEKWDGKITVWRDCENLTDFKEIEGEAIYFDINYYIERLDKALNEILEVE